MTPAQFLSRIDAKYVAELTSPQHGDPVDDARVTRALADAAAELEGYRPRIPATYWPAASTFDVHVVKVALYLLTLARPGQDFEQIRKAYDDVIAFYMHLVNAAATTDGGTPPVKAVACAPRPVFTERSLKGF